MTSGQPPSSPSAAKLGGFALIGVGAVAAVVGLATLAGGGEDTEAAPPAGEQTSAPQPPLPPLPPEPTSSPEPTSGPEPTNSAAPPPSPSSLPQPEQPPSANQPRPDAPGAEPGQAKIVVRVYNNSTIKGLAHRAADDFRSAGYEVPEVGNYARGTIPTTTVYYRPGTPEEKQAQAVASAFRAKLEPRFPGLEDASPGVIAIITNDYKGISGGKGGS